MYTYSCRSVFWMDVPLKPLKSDSISDMKTSIFCTLTTCNFSTVSDKLNTHFIVYTKPLSKLKDSYKNPGLLSTDLLKFNNSYPFVDQSGKMFITLFQTKLARTQITPRDNI